MNRELLDRFVELLPTTLTWSPEMRSAYEKLDKALAGREESENLVPDVGEMVNRFVSWKLPADFHPDGGISFTPDYNQHTPWPAKHAPTGTNLFTSEQARAMFEHCLAPIATQQSRDAAVRLWNDTGEELLATQDALLGILNAIAKANLPGSLSPERQALTHACVQARRVLAASGEGSAGSAS